MSTAAPTIKKPTLVQSNVVGAKQPPELVGKPSDGSTEETKQKRPKPTKNYGTRFASEDEANKPENHPKMDDGTNAQGLKLCKVTNKAANKTEFIWARNPDHALSFVAGDLYEWSLAQPGQRGRSPKIDENLLKYARLMKKMNMTAELAQFLTDFPHYADAVNAA